MNRCQKSGEKKLKEFCTTNNLDNLEEDVLSSAAMSDFEIQEMLRNRSNEELTEIIKRLLNLLVWQNNQINIIVNKE